MRAFVLLVVELEHGEMRPTVRIAPHGDYYVCSDGAALPDAPHDYVPGIHSPSVTLAKLTVRNRIRSALDLGTGTGLAPFLSIIKDAETYERYEKIVLVHGCRQVAELAYGDFIQHELPKHEFLGDLVRDKLVYYPTVTREPFRNRGRLTDVIAGRALTDELGLPAIDAGEDRVMMCGSPAMLADLRDILERRGFAEGHQGGR